MNRSPYAFEHLPWASLGLAFLYVWKNSWQAIFMAKLYQQLSPSEIRAASPWQAVLLGGRVPIPVAPGGWRIARRLAELAGAPIPAHVLELLRRGRVADGAHATAALGLGSLVPTQAVLGDLFAWATARRLEAVA